MALSDKATYIYDYFFSADITAESFSSLLKGSSSSRIAFEQIISFPNLVATMRTHDRFDEIISAGTEQYTVFLNSLAAEQAKLLEVNCFVFMTNESNTQAAFDAFLKTAPGQVGFGSLVNNPKAAFDLANNTHAVNLLFNNSDAVKGLLNSEIGLDAFGKTSISSSVIFNNQEIFKSLRTSLRFTQAQTLPFEYDSTSNFIRYVGGKYFITEHSWNYIYVSDDLITWTKYNAPGGKVIYNTWASQTIAYDEINKRWFFIIGENYGGIYWTADFTNWNKVEHLYGNNYARTLTNWNGKIVVVYYDIIGTWKWGYIDYHQGITSYSITRITTPAYVSNPYLYGYAPDDPSYPYMLFHSGNNYVGFIDKNWEWNTAAKLGNSLSLTCERGITFANGEYIFVHNGTHTYYYKFAITEDLFTQVSGGISTTNLVFKYNFSNYKKPSYANGVYVFETDKGYATSVDGKVWDEELSDVTYRILIGGYDDKGFFGHIPGTKIVATSYDLLAQQVVVTTTTSTTTTTTATPPEIQSELECLQTNNLVNFTEYAGLKLLLNGDTTFQNKTWVVRNGDYNLLNIPLSNPLGLLSSNKGALVTMQGSNTKVKYKKILNNTLDDNRYDVYPFYYGDATIKVEGNFGIVNLWSYEKGEVYRQGILIHEDNLNGITAADTGSRVSDTGSFASSINNFACPTGMNIRSTDIVRVPTTTTTTTVNYNLPDFVDNNLVVPTTTTTAYPYNVVQVGSNLEIGLNNSSTAFTIIDTDNSVTYDLTASAGTDSYGIEEGTYFVTIPDGVYIAFEGATCSGNFGPQKDEISYSGDFYKRKVKGINNVPHYFYSGSITLIVDGDFGNVGIVGFQEGYNGGQNRIRYNYTGVPAPTTTTTTTTLDPNQEYIVCLNNLAGFTILDGNIVLDNKYTYSNLKWGLNNGIYKIPDVPSTHPITLLNHDKDSLITISSEDGLANTYATGSDGNYYNFYWGNVLINVNGDFKKMSFEVKDSGSMGGTDRFIWNSECGDPTKTFPTTTTTTTINPLYLVPTTTAYVPYPFVPAGETTTTTTTTAPVIPQYEFCLLASPSENTVTFQSINDGIQYIFNRYKGVYGMGIGTYVLANIPSTHPIAILNNGKTSTITYTGQNSAGTSTGPDGNQYEYFYGDVTITVSGDFDGVSYACKYHGYMGGYLNFVYTTNC